VTFLSRLLPYLKPQAGLLVAAYLCMVVLGLTTAFYAFLAGPAVKFVFTGDFGDILRTTDGELRSLWNLVPSAWVHTLEGIDQSRAILIVPILVVAAALFKGLAQTGQFSLTGRVSQRILRAVRADTFAAMLRQSPAFFARRAHGDLLSRLTNDANLVEQAMFRGVAPLLREPIAVLFLLVFCFVTEPRLALVTFITVPLAVWPLTRFARWLKRVSRRGQDHQGAINATAYEALAGIRVVQAFTTEERERRKLQRAAQRYYRQMVKSYFIRAVRTPTMEILGAVALAGLLAFLGHLSRTGGADPANYLSFFFAIVMMYDPLKKLGHVTDYLAAGAAATDRIFEILELDPTIQTAPDAIELPPFRHRVVFEDVRFAYETKPVLRGVSLELSAGSLVALVGASGAGKTTMAHLLPRFYDVGEGRITVDGHDIRAVELTSLRSQLSIVSQDTFLFNASVADNIGYGRHDATPEQIRAAAEAAYAHEFIERLEAGYDTEIGERGVMLSGGQRQRLAIARALLRDAPILILDEAMSALDVESERIVQRALEVLMRGRTSLVIAHRLSTIRRADTIAVLKDGWIVERGKHDELLAAGGEYARLYSMQFQDGDEGARASG
jgi:subfamily B ATP-binding cassette protein MsbA